MALKRNPALDRSVHAAARSDRPYAVAALLARTRGLDRRLFGAVLRGEAAQILFTLNRDQEAYDTGAGRLPPGRAANAALPAYIAGLAAWRMQRPDLARPMFAAAWRAGITTPTLRAAAAFWAARAHLRMRQFADFRPWMQRAAAEKRTFHGLLARRILGLGPDEDHETLSEADIEAVAATPRGLRAFALLQVGQAEPRGRRVARCCGRRKRSDHARWPRHHAGGPNRAGLSDLAAQLADLVQDVGRAAAPDGAGIAVPRLNPAGGFTVDPAMVYALARVESNFDTGLVSPAGARGLMQIMPETARFIVHAAAGERGGALHDPAVNLDLGQRYLSYLATQEAVDGDLIRLLASYNSGPGGFSRWAGAIRDLGDPLLFIEAIPIDETRVFIPRVLAFTWLYAARLQLPTPSLDELAAGVWPRYHVLAALQSVSAKIH